MPRKNSFKPKYVTGQRYSNRARFHIFQRLNQLGIPVTDGLKTMTRRGLYRFLGGEVDISVSRLQDVADELEMRFEELFRSTH